MPKIFQYFSALIGLIGLLSACSSGGVVGGQAGYLDSESQSLSEYFIRLNPESQQFFSQAQAGQSGLVQDPVLKREVEVTVRGAYFSAGGRTCKLFNRVGAKVGSGEMEDRIACENTEGHWYALRPTPGLPRQMENFPSLGQRP